MKKRYYYINLFFIMTIMGYFLEQGMMFLFHEHYNSSLLHGPWTIVYGIASIIILFIGDKTSRMKLKKYQKVLLFLTIAFLILSLLEFCGGILIEKTLGIVYWDYSTMPFHLGKYVCLPISLVWMAYASLLNYFLYPLLKRLVLKIPKIATWLLVILFLLDIGYTTFEYFHYK